MGEFEGAEISAVYVELEGQSIFQCFKVVLPSEEIKLIPKSEENADYQRLKLWNAANENVLSEVD